jgi:hypothetical protein
MIALKDLRLVHYQAETGQGLRDGIDIDIRREKDQVIVHSHADEI